MTREPRIVEVLLEPIRVAEPEPKEPTVKRSDWRCPHCGGYDAGGLLLHCSGCGRPGTLEQPQRDPRYETKAEHYKEPTPSEQPELWGLQELLNALGPSVSATPNVFSGAIVLHGTRFPAAQVLAELAEGRSLADLCNDLDLDSKLVAGFLNAVSLFLSSYRAARPPEPEPAKHPLLCELVALRDANNEHDYDAVLLRADLAAEKAEKLIAELDAARTVNRTLQSRIAEIQAGLLEGAERLEAEARVHRSVPFEREQLQHTIHAQSAHACESMAAKLRKLGEGK